MTSKMMNECGGAPAPLHEVMERALAKVGHIIEKYYASEPELKALLLTHSRRVGMKALECIRRRGVAADEDFVAEAALLHDIGIVRCDAPGILCHGTEPYIRHGVEGRTMLEAEGMLRHALVCERHTGAGLTVSNIESQNLPHREMVPLSVEEKAVCYADKFFSKSGDPEREKPLDKVVKSMARHGADVERRFMALHALFG